MDGTAFVTESLLSLVIVLSSCDLLPMEESCQHPSSGVINYNFKEGISFSHDEKEAACLVRHFYNNAFIANQDRRGGPERSILSVLIALFIINQIRCKEVMQALKSL